MQLTEYSGRLLDMWSASKGSLMCASDVFVFVYVCCIHDPAARKWELDDGKPPVEGAADKGKGSEQPEGGAQADKAGGAAAAGAGAGAGKAKKGAPAATPAGKGDEKAAGEALVGHVIEIWEPSKKAYLRGTVQVGGLGRGLACRPVDQMMVQCAGALC
jgi:hypothetical protein